MYASQTTGGRQATRRMYPSSLATVSCRSLNGLKDSVTGRETRHWESFTAVSAEMAGWELVDLDQTIKGSIDRPHRLIFLYKRFLCLLLSTSLPARGFTTLMLSAGMGAASGDHLSSKSFMGEES